MGTHEEKLTIRSIEADDPSWVSFVNATSHEVELLWINYEGQAVRYRSLGPGQNVHVTTFVSHPWIFVQAQSMERFVVQGKDVFYPKRSEPKTGPRGQPRFTPFFAAITIPLYNLREIAMRRIKLLLTDDNDAYLLDIPKNLQHELANMTPRKSRQ